MISHIAAASHRSRLDGCSCDDCQQAAADAETRFSMTMAVLGLPVGVALAWLLDWISAGPGLGVMVGQ